MDGIFPAGGSLSCSEKPLGGEVLTERVHEVYLYLRQLLLRPDPPALRFAIFSHPRSGSQLLRGLLAQHPQVQCEGEVFLKFLRTRFSRVLFPSLYLEGLAARSGASAYGCILREAHLYRVCRDTERFQRALVERGWKIIYLQRRNRVRLAISQLRAARLGLWHLWGPRVLPPLTIEPSQLLEQLRWISQCRRHEERIMATLPHLRLDYESDLDPPQAHQATAERVFSYLGLPSVPVQARTYPTRGELANRAEILQALQGTEYAQDQP